MEDPVRTDLSSVGYREKKREAELVTTYAKNPDILDDKVTIAFKFNGYVFLTREDNRTAMLNGGNLETFYSCSDCGLKGFQEKFDVDSDCEQCQQITRGEWN
jgi:hypothetical protein